MATERRREEVVLIGPQGIGKSTVASLLATRLGLPRVSMDSVRFAYYREIGYDEEHAARLRREQGFGALYRYWKPFEVHAVERVLAEHRHCVIDFGAGHSVYTDPALLARAQRALAPFRHVVLLLPAPDLDECERLLTERKGFWSEVDAEILRHPSNAVLATHTVYTAGRTPEETCADVLAAVGWRGTSTADG